LFESERAEWHDMGAPWDDAVSALAGFVGHGKFLRPRFCFWGYAATTEQSPDSQLESACAALELLHTFALIHDDVMDDSSTRRGRPSLHTQITQQHRQHGWGGDPRQYGVATAVLVGDLAFAMANRLASALNPAARQVWSRLVTELTAGQFLDLAGTARRDRSETTALKISRLKSGRYTVTGPLRLGAALDGTAELAPDLERYGDLVGEAFQLRDDLLGVFGDTERTGKPVGEDLREGKPTLLLAIGSRSEDRAVRRLLTRVGSPTLTDADVRQMADALDACGARAYVERRILDNVRSAELQLRRVKLTAGASEALTRLADHATERSS
jgi:geranylgeranyl diphosphate synthase type I